jgi:hypothetical protein
MPFRNTGGHFLLVNGFATKAEGMQITISLNQIIVFLVP